MRILFQSNQGQRKYWQNRGKNHNTCSIIWTETKQSVRKVNNRHCGCKIHKSICICWRLQEIKHDVRDLILIKAHPCLIKYLISFWDRKQFIKEITANSSGFYMNVLFCGYNYIECRRLLSQNPINALIFLLLEIWPWRVTAGGRGRDNGLPL